MRKFFIQSFFICVFLLCFSCSSVNNIQTSKIESNANCPASCFYKDKSFVSDLTPDPDLICNKLSNGFRYVLLPNKKPKDRVSIHLNVQVGSMNETDEQQGLAHFLEHMLFNGSTHFKPGELVEYFQSIGMKFGADANAHTGFDETVYDIFLPNGNKETLEKGFLVLRDYADGALIRDKEVDKERKIILAEKQTRDSASYRTFVSVLNFEFPDALISKRLPIGKEDIIRNANHDILKKIYNTWYNPKTMVLVVVGDFNPDTAIPLIEQKFSDLSVKIISKSAPDFGEIEHQGIKGFYHFEQESGNTDVTIEIVKKIEPEKDSFDLRKELLIQDIANKIVQNRLDSLLRKSSTPFTAAHIHAGHYFKQIKSAEINAECSPLKWEETLSILEQTLRQALKYGFLSSELERVKKEYTSLLENEVKTASTRESTDIARQIIKDLNQEKVFLSPVQEKEIFVPIINSLTIDTVHNSFKQMWDIDHRLVLVTGNAKINSNTLSSAKQIEQVFKQSMEVKILKPFEKQQVIFPYLTMPQQQGKIIEKKEIKDLGIIKMVFNNQCVLNLKKTDFKANQVLFALSFGDGKKTEPKNMPGLSLLSTHLINESGLGQLNKEELSRALAGKNTSISFSVSDDQFMFTGSSVSDEAELLFQLLYHYLKDPGFREESYDLVMEKFDQQYLSYNHSIDGAVLLHAESFLAGGDNRFGLPAQELFQKNSLENVKEWVGKALQKSNFELSIVGDFDIDHVTDLALKYFANLSIDKSSDSNLRKDMPSFPESKKIELDVDTEINKALVIVSYPTDDFWNITRTRKLSLLSEVLSERMRKSIREKLGASYSQYAYNNSSRVYPGYGILKTLVYTDPNKTDMVAKQIKHISDELVSKGISEQELKLARDPILTHIKDVIKTNGYWLNTVLVNSARYPVQLEWARSIEKEYKNITAQDITDIAKQYLDNYKSAVIVIESL